MNKKGVVISLLLVMSWGRAEVLVKKTQVESDEKMHKQESPAQLAQEFDTDDFFGDYQACETIKRTAPQHRSAISVFVMQSGLWALMKLDGFFKNYTLFKKWLIRWMYGKRKA